MSELAVRIVELEPMRVASVLGFSATPEKDAHEMMMGWARPKGLLDKPFRWFGFNNPNPSPGSPHYGYEVWLPVDQDVPGAGDVRIKQFSGGLYAVTRCEGLQNIGERWQQLVAWVEDSHYQCAQHQWLEELFTVDATRLEEYVFDLYLPIAR